MLFFHVRGFPPVPVPTMEAETVLAWDPNAPGAVWLTIPELT